MRESMPETHGWVDRGPARGGSGLKPGHAGPVRAAPGPHEHPNLPDELELCAGAQCPFLRARVAPPYDPARLSEIIKQGRENPRPLSLQESRLAARNRGIFRDDVRSTGRWEWLITRPSDSIAPGMTPHMVGGVSRTPTRRPTKGLPAGD